MIATLTCAEEATVGLDTDVSQLRRGDLDALSALVARYQNRLYRYLLRLVRNSADADDLFQQTWIRVAEQIRRYDPNRNFDAWLFTLARHLAIDFLRRRHPGSLDEPPADDPHGETMAAKLAAKEPPALDGDPFVGRQDWDISDLAIEVKETGAVKAIGTVTFMDSGKPQKVVLELLRSGNDWRIADIEWGSGSLRGLYRRRATHDAETAPR